MAVCWSDGNGEGAREGGQSSCFPILHSDQRCADNRQSLKSRALIIPADDMTTAVRHNAVRRRLKMRPDAQLVAHRTTHDEQSGWEASDFCNEALEVVRGFVFAKDIISEPCTLGQSEGV